MTAIATTSDAKPARRRRRWLRWTLISLATLIMLLVVAVVAYVKLAPVPAPLALAASPASAPAGPTEGTWTAGSGSQAGFRIEQTVLFVSNEVVQRTSAVTGTATATTDQITAATFRVDLTTITAENGEQTPQLVQSLDTEHHPDATVTLTQPVPIDPALGTGGAVTTTVAGELTLRGVTHPVTITVSARRDGTTLQAAGSMPVVFADWGIPSPTGYGSLGSLADRGVAEFLLTLNQK